MEREWKRVHRELGPTGVAIMGSGQYTIQEGYAAVEARQGGLALQQPRPQRPALHGLGGRGLHADLRHRRAVGLLRRHRAHRHGRAVGRQHGGDAPHALGAHRRPASALAASYRVVQPHHASRNRSSDGADVEIVFKPNTDLAIWNYIAREIVARGAVDRTSSSSTASSPPGPTDIGYGMRDTSDFAYAAEKDTQARERVVVLTREEAIARGLDPSARHERRQEAGRRGRAPTGSSPSRSSRRRSSPTPSTSWPSSRQGRSRRAARRVQGEAQGARRPLRRPEAARSSRTGPWASTSTRAAPG